MNSRSILTITILGTSVCVVVLLALVLTIIYLRRRCKKTTTTTEETDERSITTTTTAKDGVNNFALIEDGLVSVTKQHAPDVPDDVRTTPEELDPRVEQMLDDAYADARQFAKFPNLP